MSSSSLSVDLVGLNELLEAVLEGANLRWLNLVLILGFVDVVDEPNRLLCIVLQSRLHLVQSLIHGIQLFLKRLKNRLAL